MPRLGMWTPWAAAPCTKFPVNLVLPTETCLVEGSQAHTMRREEVAIYALHGGVTSTMVLRVLDGRQEMRLNLMEIRIDT